ncbi:hypothetical protein E1193_13490 [Micromonospora sp. KC606]|uniref:hypothetical protein n=1 Tax=Micromonospora sp. KC606 TaxID=2530379 RepID=UPI00104C895B|nr:hypothetical protein [Micromonospora sp. KC606]TDC81910.1 hypothetical protein E1193_13490 [Micromonospora sp. KC606]
MSYATGDSLAVRVRIAFGASIAADPATWTWTDVTAWWHVPDDVTIGWGRSSGAEHAEFSTMSLTLKNDGRFTAYNPLSPYWPNVRKWTPIEFDIDLGDGAGWRNRFSGFIRRWPLTWPGRSGLMALARIDAVGILGRIGRGQPPARSPMQRTISASSPVAYWPGEDGVLSSQAGAATSGVAPLTVGGVVEFQPVDDYVGLNGLTTRYGTTALANLAGGGSLSAQLPAAAVAATAGGPWTMHVAMQVNTFEALPADVVVLEWTTSGGTYTRWQIVVTTTNRTQVVAYTAAGAATTLIDHGSATPTFDTYAVSASVSGGTVTVKLYRDAVTPSTTFAGSLGGITSVAVNPTRTTMTVDMPAGHLAVWAADSPPVARSGFIDSYGGFVRESRRSWQFEAATDRLVRLCAEDGVPLAMPAVPAIAVQRMGWQTPDRSQALHEECEAVDGGLLYESGFGLGYLPRSARYNPPVVLTIDADAGQLGSPFEPVDDDQRLRNQWTVERAEGSSATVADPVSIVLQGRIEASVTLNLSSDAPLGDHAGWRLHLSTVDEPRYPAVSINLAAAPELATAWCSCRPGSRIQVVNPPEQNVPGTVDQIVVGATEVYRGRRSWRATMNVEPAAPWLVATASGPQRAAAAGSTLAADITAGALSLSLTTTADGLWTTKASAFPLDLLVGGERVTVSAITGTSSPQPATVTARAVNGVSRSWPAGTPVQVWSPAVVPL